MTPHAPPGVRARVLVAGALLVGTWGAIALTDAAAERAQRAAEQAAPPVKSARDDTPPTRGRLFVLLVDSLPRSRAEDLPSVAALRQRSLFLRVTATRDAATVPSLRAAFTGRTQRSIFAFVSNFIHHDGDLGGPSVLAQAAARGDRVAVFSDGSFYELAASVADGRPNERGQDGDEEVRQVRAFHEALSLFAEGRHGVVVFHLTTVDHAGHTRGTRDPAYAHAFDVVDGLIREAEAAIPPGDTFVLMGDHGHDEDGRHFPGLDVPTAALYRGPGFRPGVTLGPVPLTLHRYLMSWALGLPLSAAYRGAGAPEALVGTPVPAAFLKPPAEISATPLRSTRFAWLAPLALALAGAAAWGAHRLAPRLVTSGRAIVAAAIGAPLFVAWGAFLANRRLSTPPPRASEILTSWGIAGALALIAVVSGRMRRMTATWLVLALPAVFLYPGAAWDGWASIMTPAWLVGLALLVLDRARRGPLLAVTRSELLAFASLPLTAALLLPFFYAEADGVASGDWSGYLSSNSITYWLPVSVIARLVLFARPGRGSAGNVVALAVVGALTLVSFGDALPTQDARLVAAGGLAVAALVAARRAPRAVADVLVNAALLMGWRSTVVLEERSFLQLEILLAALRLTAIAGDRLGRAEDRRPFAAWLQAMAVIVAAWTTLALTLHRLEWSVLYRFLPASTVERHVGVFLPLIIGRYALPLVLARRLLVVEDGAGARAWHASAGALLAKLATLVLVVIGSAVLDPTSEPFMGAVQCALTLSVLSVALVFAPRPQGAT